MGAAARKPAGGCGVSARRLSPGEGAYRSGVGFADRNRHLTTRHAYRIGSLSSHRCHHIAVSGGAAGRVVGVRQSEEPARAARRCRNREPAGAAGPEPTRVRVTVTVTVTVCAVTVCAIAVCAVAVCAGTVCCNCVCPLAGFPPPLQLKWFTSL